MNWTRNGPAANQVSHATRSDYSRGRELCRLEEDFLTTRRSYDETLASGLTRSLERTPLPTFKKVGMPASPAFMLEFGSNPRASGSNPECRVWQSRSSMTGQQTAISLKRAPDRQLLRADPMGNCVLSTRPFRRAAASRARFLFAARPGPHARRSPHSDTNNTE